MKDSLGDRMKHNYEEVFKQRLVSRMPVVVRIDGKAFHTFTKGFMRPYDEILARAMQDTMQYLCQNVQNCVFGYTQSDEITLVLCDYKTINTCAYFDNEVQKICSVTASMATMAFNRYFAKRVAAETAEVVREPEEKEKEETHAKEEDTFAVNLSKEQFAKLMHKIAASRGAMFDSRCFNVPVGEVANMIIWRQQDATRNSIASAAQSMFSHAELEGKNTSEMQDMMMAKGVNWNDYPTFFKRGSACIREAEDISHDVVLEVWRIDDEMPIITQNRDYVERLIEFEED